MLVVLVKVVGDKKAKDKNNREGPVREVIGWVHL